MVNVCSVILENTCHLLPDFGHQYLREFSTRSGAHLQLWYEYLWPVRSEEGAISDDQTGVHWTYIEDNKDSVEV